ncbi:metal ABC transporter ATP-binding protein [Deltaproteobacteria bacterium TL4]
MSVLNIQELNFAYSKGITVLEKVNLVVEQGDFLVILGPNGGGKTTLLKLILGLLKPITGTIELFGKKSAKEVQRIGYVPQQTSINTEFPVSVLDVVLMGAEKTGNFRWEHYSQRKEAALKALDRVGMTDLSSNRIGKLSGGQRQRVIIARALMSQPELLMLDEPTASIDNVGKGEFYELLQQLNQSMTIISISHDMSIIPAIAKSIACINRTLHFHPAPELTPEMLKMIYGYDEDACPIELVAHGMPHRTLHPHE